MPCILIAYFKYLCQLLDNSANKHTAQPRFFWLNTQNCAFCWQSDIRNMLLAFGGHRTLHDSPGMGRYDEATKYPVYPNPPPWTPLGDFLSPRPPVPPYLQILATPLTVAHLAVKTADGQLGLVINKCVCV